MKGRFILDLDPRDSLESNLEFLKDCERQINARRERLINLHKKPDKKVNIKRVENLNTTQFNNL